MTRQNKRPVSAPAQDAPAKASSPTRTPDARAAVRLPGGRIGILSGKGQALAKSFSSFTSFQSSILGPGAEKFGTERISRPYEQSDWVYACVSLIQDAFAELPLRVYPEDPLRTKDEVEPVPESDPLSILFRDWNPVHTASLANTAMAQGLCLDGEIAFVLTGGGGQRLDVFGEGRTARISTPEEIWPVAGPSIREKIDRRTGMVESWNVIVAGRPKEYDPATVLMPRILHPRNPFRGFGPMEAAWGPAAQNYLAERYRNSVLKNGGEPGGIVMIGEILDPDDRDRLKDEIAEEFDDLENSGGTRLLEGGATYEARAFNPKEMAYVESLAANQDRVSAVFRVSKELLGQGDSNFAARLREELAALYKLRVIPWARLIENEFNAHLFPRLADRRAQGYRVRFDFSKVEALQGDLAAKADLGLKLQRSGIPLNLAMKIAGVSLDEPIPGGDVPLLVGSWRPLEEVAAPSGLEGQAPEPEAPANGEAPQPASPGPEAPASSNVADSEAAADPRQTLNGGQVSGLVDIVERVLTGELPKATAVEVIVAGFPFDRARAEQILAQVEEGENPPPVAPAEPPSDSADEPAEERAIRALERAGVALGASSRDLEDDIEDVYPRWKRLANMTATQLKAWDRNPCSRKASVDAAAVIERNLDLLETPKGSWQRKQVTNAKRAISFIERMRANPAGEPAAEGCPSKRTISLKNWAHDPGGKKEAEPEPQPEQTALERAAARDPLADATARREFTKAQERRRRPREATLRAKFRRVFDAMRRAQLRALDEFIDTGQIPEPLPRIDNWTLDPPRRSHPAQGRAILQRAERDGAELKGADDWLDGPEVASFAARRDWSPEDVERHLDAELVRKAEFPDAEIELLVLAAEKRWADELARLVEPVLGEILAAELEVVAGDLGITQLAATDPAVVRFLATKPIEVAEGVNSTIARQVRRRLLRAVDGAPNVTTLQQALLEIRGLITDDVRTVYSHARQRALAIARTEAGIAAAHARAAQIQAGVDEGVVIGKRWITGGGAPERFGGARRDTHWDLDGTVVGPNEDFQVGAERAPHPRHQSLSAGNVVNCGCDFAAIVEDVPEVVLPGDSELDPPDAVGAPGAVPPTS